jgi:hypothetical protein
MNNTGNNQNTMDFSHLNGINILMAELVTTLVMHNSRPMDGCLAASAEIDVFISNNPQYFPTDRMKDDFKNYAYMEALS